MPGSGLGDRMILVGLGEGGPGLWSAANPPRSCGPTTWSATGRSWSTVMTTTSRGLGEGPGPTPASKQRSDRIMSGKVHGRGGSCGGRDDVAAPDARGDQERARDDDGARKKRHARTEALVRETRPDRPDHAGDAPQGLLHPQHQSVLVLVRAVADERRVS